MWQGPEEMDDTSWTAIEKDFKPVRGMDISTTKHPIANMHRKYVAQHSSPHFYLLMLPEPLNVFLS